MGVTNGENWKAGWTFGLYFGCDGIRCGLSFFFFWSTEGRAKTTHNPVQDLDLENGSVQFSCCRVRLFATMWITARQASLSITNSRSSLKLMSIESVMPSSHLFLCRPFFSCPQSLPASGSFPMSQLFAWAGQSIGVSASASVLSMNTQDWFPLEWTGWISL